MRGSASGWCEKKASVSGGRERGGCVEFWRLYVSSALDI